MRSVLIIDDDVRLSEMLRQYLVRHEILLTTRSKGAEGLDAAQNHRHDLVLLDVMLPDINGFEVLRRLREASDVRVVLLTARGDAADRVHGLRMGADDYIPKPFDVEELVARIDAVLRRGTVPEDLAIAPPGSRLQRGSLALDLRARIVMYRADARSYGHRVFSSGDVFAVSGGRPDAGGARRAGAAAPVSSAGPQSRHERVEASAQTADIHASGKPYQDHPQLWLYAVRGGVPRSALRSALTEACPGSRRLWSVCCSRYSSHTGSPPG